MSGPISDFSVCLVVQSEVPTKPNLDYIKNEMFPWMERNLTGKWVVEAVASTHSFYTPCRLIGPEMVDSFGISSLDKLFRPHKELRVYFDNTNDAAKWRMFYEFGWKGLRRMSQHNEEELGYAGYPA